MQDVIDAESNTIDIPLCVDLDGSLIKTDTLHELALKLIKSNFIHVFFLPLWLLQGKAYLKAKLNALVTLNEELLPYDKDVLTFLKSEKDRGRKLYLVTGCNQSLAQKIADFVGIFDEVFASSSELNLTGQNKANFLSEKFGDRGFDYLGNEKADFKVWEKSHTAFVVGTRGFFASVQSKVQKCSLIHRPSASFKTYLKAIRVHQWVKNCLIFVPFFLDFQTTESIGFLLALAGFFAFSFMASATYIINDLLDLESDRAHVKKRFRAFAAGEITVLSSLLMAIVLFAVTLFILSFLPLEFALVSLVYLITTLLYSFHIKTMVILDTCVLAGLFTIRVIGGTAVIGAEWSFWLLAFSMFFFLSLAFTKRASELNALIVAGKESAKGRGYIVGDAALVTSMGVSAGYIGVLVIALYINSTKVSSNYASPFALWLICPLLLYWIGRIWLKTVRGEMNEDPIVFALKDRISHITALCCVGVVFAAMLNW